MTFGKCVLQRRIVISRWERFGLESHTPSPNLHLLNLWAKFAVSFPKSRLAFAPDGAANCSNVCVPEALTQRSFFYPKGNRPPAEVVGKQIGKERLVLITSRREDHPPARRIQDLAGVQWILNPEGCAARAALRSALLRANIDMAVAVEAYSYELQLALVAQNRGLSLVPERILKRSRLRARLRALRVPGLNFPLTIWMVYCQPISGFDAVIGELSRILRRRL